MVQDYHALTPQPALAPPVIQVAPPASGAWLDPAIGFAAGAQAFGRFAIEKLRHSPRLKPWQRRALLSLFDRGSSARSD
jgi:hypothetical protein